MLSFLYYIKIFFAVATGAAFFVFFMQIVNFYEERDKRIVYEKEKREALKKKKKPSFS